MRKQDHNRAVVLAALPGTQREIADRTGLGLATVWRWLEGLYAAREAFIGAWVLPPHGGPVTGVWQAGNQRHVRCTIKIRTNKRRTADNRRRLRESGEWEDVLAKRRAQYHANKAPRRDRITVALFGAA